MSKRKFVSTKTRFELTDKVSDLPKNSYLGGGGGQSLQFPLLLQCLADAKRGQ